jgi:hypothetical protein
MSGVALDPKHRTIPQMLPLLSRFDDRFGIVWRLANAIRRISPSRSWRFMRAWMRPRTHARPILIVGMPRSGTQFLFHLLRESSELGSMPWEGHDVWRRFHHPRSDGWRSDHVGAGAIRPGERRFVAAAFQTYTGDKRLVEKTADNVVRIPYLLELFPDAIFVVMKRNPCDVLNSYINMWRHPTGRFRSYFVPVDLKIKDYPRERMWCSTLIDGWRDLTASTIPEIAFAQWLRYVDCIDKARGSVPNDQWVELFLEDVLRHPDDTMHTLYSRIGIASEPALDAKLTELLANPINSMSPAGHEKWRSQNAAEIRTLLPGIAEHASRLGYIVDPTTGAVSYASEGVSVGSRHRLERRAR